MQLIINYYIDQNCISGGKLSMELKNYLEGIKIKIETVVQKSKDNKDSKNLTTEQSSSSVSTSGPPSFSVSTSGLPSSTMNILDLKKELEHYETEINNERKISEENIKRNRQIINKLGYNFGSGSSSSVSTTTPPKTWEVVNILLIATFRNRGITPQMYPFQLPSFLNAGLQKIISGNIGEAKEQTLKKLFPSYNVKSDKILRLMENNAFQYKVVDFLIDLYNKNTDKKIMDVSSERAINFFKNYWYPRLFLKLVEYIYTGDVGNTMKFIEDNLIKGKFVESNIPDFLYTIFGYCKSSMDFLELKKIINFCIINVLHGTLQEDRRKRKKEREEIEKENKVTSGQSTLGTSTLSSTSTPQSTEATVGLLGPIIKEVHTNQANLRQSLNQSNGGNSFKSMIHENQFPNSHQQNQSSSNQQQRKNP